MTDNSSVRRVAFPKEVSIYVTKCVHTENFFGSRIVSMAAMTVEVVLLSLSELRGSSPTFSYIN